MRVGFLTNALRTLTLEEIADWAYRNGFEFLEVGPHIPAEKEVFKKVIDKTGLEVTALIFCRNFQHREESIRRALREELNRRVDLACTLGFKFVTISTGQAEDKGFEENLALFKEFITPIAEKCEKHDVRIAIENCPDTGNIAVSPYRWRKIFEEIEFKNLGLCYDPSHLIRLFIDPYEPIKEFADRILYVHVKDTLIDDAKLSDMGIVEPKGWWSYKLPGLGLIDWDSLLALLRDYGFNGDLSIEHEDLSWMGSEERVKEGLLFAKNYVEKLPSFG